MAKKSPFEYKLDRYKKEQIIWILFPKNLDLEGQVKKIKKVEFSKLKNSWYLKDTKSNRIKLGLSLESIDEREFQKVNSINRQAFSDFIKALQLKGYRDNTVKIYKNEFVLLLNELKTIPIKKMTTERLKSYFYHCASDLNYSDIHLQSKINAIKFYFDKVIGDEKICLNIPRPARKLVSKNRLSNAEIERVFQETTNAKHLLILKLVYNMGIKITEIVSLKLKAVDLNERKIYIAGMKGKGNRVYSLSKEILVLLRTYLKEYSPSKFLFEGESRNQYSIRSVQSVVKTAMGKANVRKEVGVHGIRPKNYSDLLLEYGADPSVFIKLVNKGIVK